MGQDNLNVIIDHSFIDLWVVVLQDKVRAESAYVIYLGNFLGDLYSVWWELESHTSEVFMHDLAQRFHCNVEVVHGTRVGHLNEFVDDLNNVWLSTRLDWSEESFSDRVSAT